MKLGSQQVKGTNAIGAICDVKRLSMESTKDVGIEVQIRRWEDGKKRKIGSRAMNDARIVRHSRFRNSNKILTWAPCNRKMMKWWGFKRLTNQ